MNQTLSVRDISNMSFFGNDPSSVTLTTNATYLHSTSLTFTNFSQITSDFLDVLITISLVSCLELM